MIQDRLDDYIDVDVGKVEKIDPNLLVEEKLDFLIFGEIVSKEIPSLELQQWLENFWEISKKNNTVLKAISGFYIALADIKAEPFWLEYRQHNVNTEIFYPPMLRLKIDSTGLGLKNNALDMVKNYTQDFIDFFIITKK